MKNDRILVVDDHPGICRLLSEILTETGYRVQTALSGREALLKIGVESPHLIILDIKMPGMSGLETLSELQKLDESIPVIMMSAYGELDLLKKAKEDGLVTHYIGKPFDLREMMNLIYDILTEVMCRESTAKELV